MSKFEYSKWRHGGWYVDNVRYPSGAIGCVSCNYPDKKWRIVCDPREPRPTFKNRDAAALGELQLIASLPAKDGHTWVNANAVVKWPHCSVCLAIKRIDGQNGKCKGPAKLSLRKELPPYLTEGEVA